MARPKVLLTRRWPEAVEQHLQGRYEVTLNTADTPMSQEAMAEALRTHDAVCPTVTDDLNAQVLERGAGAARILGNFGVGVNHIDLAACGRLGLAVTNTPDVLTDATAELAILLMLMSARRAGEGERHVRGGAWIGWRPTHMIGAQVTGKTLGLVGFGRIAQATARKAHHGLGMSILYHSRRRAPPEVEAACGAGMCASLEELLERSDFVSLHCPGGAETFHLIDAARLARMKPSAFLINTARGPVVDEAALTQALSSGAIAGAGLDVYEAEPRVPDALKALENVVLLPHLGSATAETRIAMGMRVAANLDAFFDGAAPPDRLV
jgi:lactate dehydrogenase-like 2-hydroxyacid dehydrogenase